MNTRVRSAISRREAIRNALMLCVAGGGVERTWSAELPASNAPLSRPIPSSGERIPIVGLGTDSFREDARDAIRAEIQRMHELGGTVIDTAAAYGPSEALIGEALVATGLRDRMFIATKLSATAAYDRINGEASFLRSLERLHAHIDLLQIHNLDGMDSLMPLLQKWKQSGMIRYLGVTTSLNSQHAGIVEAMRRYPLDFIQVDYSIGNRDAATTVLPVALERKVAVLVNLPLERAALIGQASQRQLPDWVSSIDVKSWSQFFLKYVISHPAVTCAIPGS
ncbi:MAG TPA: aldo/keto reductase, partial [Steroidobacteraceae bacterium]|nr:aldo/keto reductase [Steroidobacteraceae bacterium]